MSLTQKTCIPCKGGIPPLTKDMAETYLAEVPAWKLSDEAGRLNRRFEFDDFKASMAFVQKIGDLAEAEGHHPDITFGWGYAEILLYTHKIGGLHENDFIMAAKIEAIG